MKNFLILVVSVIALVSCNLDENQENYTFEDNEYVDQMDEFEDNEYVKPMFEFVFNSEDTCVSDVKYCKYIPIEQVDSTSKIVPCNRYVRYHNDDSTSVIFTRDYIRSLCLNSFCITQEKQDTIFGYGKVKETSFPEAHLGFAYDEWEDMIVYSFINFEDKFWYTDFLSDGITVTSDIESTLWNLLPYAEDSLLASANVYKLDEKMGVDLDYTVDIYLDVWDITRKFYNYPIFEGVKKDDFIVYSNEAGLTFIRPIGSYNLKSAFLNGYTIEDSLSLNKLEDCFMEKLLNLPVRDDVFVEQYQP